MDPVRNPFAPGAGTPPPELAGRDELRETVRIALERVRRGLPTKSILMVGLRGVGKTVLLDRMRDDAEGAGIQTVRIEAPEGRSLPAMLAPQLRQALLRLSRNAQAKAMVATRALRALAGFARALKVKYDDIEVGRRLRSGTGARRQRRPRTRPAGAARSGRAPRRKTAGTALAMFIDELQYVEEAQLAALITALHRAAQRRLPIVLVGAGPAAVARPDGAAKSYAERLFEFPEIGPLPTEADARIAIAKPAKDEGVRHQRGRARADRQDDAGLSVFPAGVGQARVGCRDASRRSRAADVKRASAGAVAALDESFFRVRFDRLTPSEKVYLRAMAELGPGPHRSGDIADAAGAQGDFAWVRRAIS